MIHESAVVREFKALLGQIDEQIATLKRGRQMVTGLFSGVDRARMLGRLEALEETRDRVAAFAGVWELIGETEQMPIAAEREPLGGQRDCSFCLGAGRIPAGPGRKDILCDCSVGIWIERVARPCPRCSGEPSALGQLVGCSACDHWAKSVRDWNEAAEGAAHAATLQVRKLDLVKVHSRPQARR